MRTLPGYPMPVQVAMPSQQGPFILADQQQGAAPIVLLAQQTVPAAVNSDAVNNLIMYSQQQPHTLMTSDELNHRVDQQIKQHWCLLADRTSTQTVASLPVVAPVCPSVQHHCHPRLVHSHSACASPDTLNRRKRNVCFNDTIQIRNYSSDDMSLSPQSLPAKSCLRSSSMTRDERPSSIDWTCHTSISDSSDARTNSACTAVHQTPSALNTVEHWHRRQLKSAPGIARSFDVVEFRFDWFACI
jgi:hypothetical protein